MEIKHKTTGNHTLEEWNKIIEDWEKSGLSKGTYCKEKKIKPPTFYYWKNKVDLTFRKESYMETFKEWELIIEDWKKSGLHKNAYCKEKNIQYGAFYAWEKKVDPLPSAKQIKLFKEWEIIVEDWLKSGVSIPVYCKEKKINSVSFYIWKNKVRPSLGKGSYLRAVEKWAPIIEDWKKSGLGRGNYCKEKNLRSSLFYMWEKRLDPSYKPKEVRLLEKQKAIVEDWEKSGLSRHAYCIQNGLTASSLYQWERKINPSVSKKTSHMVALEKWTPIIEDWKKSDLNVYVYCKKNGLPLSSLYTWRKKLNPSEHSQPSSDPIREAQPNPEVSLQDFFVPFSLSSGPSSTNPKIEIVLPQGHRLSVEGHFDWEELTAWLTPLLTR